MRKRYKRQRLGVIVAAVAILAIGYMIDRNMMNVNYAPLLSVIAQGESRGNYNAYFGHAGNRDIDFTAMTVDEVLSWQQQYVDDGSPSNAVGKYQFIRPTLAGLIDELRVDRDAKFDADLQDQLAVHLIKRRGVEQYLRGRISREQFAHNLSMEWAALPRAIGANPHASYYDGDGLNKAQISVDQILAAVDSVAATKI